MRALAVICLLSFLVTSCNTRKDTGKLEPKTGTENRSRLQVVTPPASPLHALRNLSSLPSNRQETTLATQIYYIPDEDLDLVVESIAANENPAEKQALLSTLFEETRIRPALARLPLVLEIARHPDTHPSLRTTILADLGATLQCEHGSSWADWALAVEEHLAETEGLIRVQ